MEEGERFVRPSRTWRVGLGAVLGVAVLALGGTVATGVLQGTAASSTDVVVAPTVDSGDLYVHVSGAVVVPGLYVLPAGSRVADAVAAAGGFTDTADTTSVNLARVLDDGEQLVVGEQGGDPAQPGVSADGRININSASATELEELPRIGPALAQRIVEWREENGRFAQVEDLLLVPGIGEKMLEQLRDLVRV